MWGPPTVFQEHGWRVSEVLTINEWERTGMTEIDVSYAFPELTVWETDNK